MSKQSLFQKRHYFAIAELVRTNNDYKSFVDDLIRLFEEDNPRFDMPRFRDWAIWPH